jgi:hypothetical protein
MIKTMGTSMPALKKERRREKKRMNKIAHVFLQIFPGFK